MYMRVQARVKIGTMDDGTTTLISELLQKLAELQQKVNEYSQDMAQEFKLYEDKILKDVPKDVSSKVERAITNSLHNYPALKSGLDHQHQHQLQSQQQQHHHHPGADSYLPLTTSISFSSSPIYTTHTHDTIPTNNVNQMAQPRNRGSPPPVSTPVSGSPPDSSPSSPRSPRERELELHGLFIPSYLPLLEGTERHSPAPTSSLPTVPENGDRNLDRGEVTPPQSFAPIVADRPDPVRRHTEDTLSSNTSDDSNSRVKRSALRRSSSSSTKTFSPRRVRFDVEGQEVLPTASPQTRPSNYPNLPVGDPTNIFNESYQPSITEDDDLALLGGSPPRPKKITSTEKLKALARSSTEDTSAWTVVGNLHGPDDEEDELVMASLNRRRRGVTPQAAAMTQNPEPRAHSINGACPSNHLGVPLQMVKESEENADVDLHESDDDILSMPPLTSFRGRKRFSPPESTTPTLEQMPSPHHKVDKKNAPITSTTYESHNSSDNGEEDTFFEFDGMSPEKPDTKYIEEEDEAEDVKTESSAEVLEETQHPTARSIPISQPNTPVVTSPPPGRTHGTSVGSLRGKAIHMGSIRNEEVYEKAVAMGDFQSFIGSVDGRTGIDESTSYQPESMRFFGTPKSFSERLMKEELEEMRRESGSASPSASG